MEKVLQKMRGAGLDVRERWEKWRSEMGGGGREAREPRKLRESVGEVVGESSFRKREREDCLARKEGLIDGDESVMRGEPGEEKTAGEFGSKSAKDDGVRGGGTRDERWVPQTEIEFVEMIKRMPESALSQEGRQRLAAVMSFDEKMVRDLMVPRGKMIFVKENEVLGPLVLDKLYKSGFTSFPVVDERDEVLGIIHTEALNALEIREADKAKKYLDQNVQYLRTNDSLLEAVEKMEQTGGFYYLVKAENGLVVGFLTVGMMLEYLLGK